MLPSEKPLQNYMYNRIVFLFYMFNHLVLAMVVLRIFHSVVYGTHKSVSRFIFHELSSWCKWFCWEKDNNHFAGGLDHVDYMFTLWWTWSAGMLRASQQTREYNLLCILQWNGATISLFIGCQSTSHCFFSINLSNLVLIHGGNALWCPLFVT